MFKCSNPSEDIHFSVRCRIASCHHGIARSRDFDPTKDNHSAKGMISQSACFVGNCNRVTQMLYIVIESGMWHACELTHATKKDQVQDVIAI
jgi:hypothetical protein